jgi:hypothetical protein
MDIARKAFDMEQGLLLVCPIAPKPHKDSTGTSIDVSHQWNVPAFLVVVVLIDAHGICPERPQCVARSEPSKSI